MEKLLRNLQIIFITSLLILIPLNYASAQSLLIKPDAAPEVGEGFTDDFRVMLEEHQPVIDFNSLAKDQSRGLIERPAWSDSYWPVYRGVIATRYADPRVPNTKDWSVHHNFYVNNPPTQFVANNDIDKLSPAEKYDLLVGDSNWTLTKKMWEQGQKSYNQWGAVPTWTGICHGWAAASQVGIPQPVNGVTMMDKEGRGIHFTPFDIQGLVSYLWSRPQGEDLFTGRRCNSKAPEMDGDRIVTPSCFDVNPMTWHLAITNRVGLYKKSLIMDTSEGAEVWNYPVESFKIKYFHPMTMEFTDRYEQAILPLAEYTDDPFKKYRYEGTKKVVGVMMDVFHPGAVLPRPGRPELQLLEKKRFIYDLELDENNNVVGGEWYSKEHPDFMWLYPEKYNPFINAELNLLPIGDDGAPHLSETEVKAALNSSGRGLLVPEIVYKILHRSL